MSTDTVHTPHREEAVYVYQAPVRLWHWINAFAIDGDQWIKVGVTAIVNKETARKS